MKKGFRIRFYEKIGIKKFRAFTYKFALFVENIRYKNKRSPEEIKRWVYHEKPNYNISSKLNLDSLRNFKDQLYFNAYVHTYAILLMSLSLIFSSTFINSLFCLSFIFPNLYCIMIQDYNRLRINAVLKKYSKLEEKEKDVLKENIKQETNSLQVTNYKLKRFLPFNHHLTKTITFQEAFANMTKEELKDYLEYLKILKTTLENNDSLSSKDTAFFLNDNKYLILELKK